MLARPFWKGIAMVLHNPFTPSFGIIPPYMAGREDLIEELSNAFSNGLGDPNLSTIVSGPRGSGKTALLSFVAEEAASQGWISANTTAATGMLEDVLDQATVAARDFLDSLDGKKLKGITIGQFVGFEWDNETPRSGNWRTQMNALLDQLRSTRWACSSRSTKYGSISRKCGNLPEYTSISCAKAAKSPF